MVVVGRTGRPRAFTWASRRSLKGAGRENELALRAARRSDVAVLAVTPEKNPFQALSRFGKTSSA